MHQLVGSNDGIGWTGGDAQSAANAPILVYHGDGTGSLVSIDGVQRQRGSVGECCQSLHALVATRRALVNARTI